MLIDTPASLNRVLSSELRQVAEDLRGFCEPHCGRVSVEASPRTGAMEVERIKTDVARVLYNDGFVRRIADTYGPYALYAMMAHEYGHQLDNLPCRVRFTRELRADAFAGCAIARAGAPALPALRWMRQEHFEEIVHQIYKDPEDPDEVVQTYVGSTHPPWLDRIRAFAQGVEVCRASDGSLAAAEFFGRARTEELEPDRYAVTAPVTPGFEGAWLYGLAPARAPNGAMRFAFGRYSEGLVF